LAEGARASDFHHETHFNDIAENDVYTAYGALIRELSRLGLAYLHVLNRGGADLPTRVADIDNSTADVIAVASMSLANRI